MRKKIVGIMLLTLSLIVFPTKANAELSCDRSVEYNITTVDQQCIQLNGLAYRMNLYTATLNGSPIKTYCIDPVLRNGSGVNRCVRRIDPSSNANGAYTQAYDVAVTKAYQILTEDGRNTTSTADRILGEVIFRWLGANYGQMTSASHPNAVATSGCGYRIVPSQLVSIFSNPFLTAYWNTGNPDFEYGKSVFNEAVEAGNMILSGSTYEQVVEATNLWNDEYNFNTTFETRDGVTYATVNMTLTNDVQTVYWSQFKGGCSNSTVKCTTIEASGSENTGKVVIQVTEAANYDGQPYGIYIDSAIYDIRSSSANMIIVQGSARNQRMLLVADGSSNITSNPDFPSGGGRHHTDDNGNRNYCICDESTGYYVYTDENGNKTQWPEGSSRPSNVPSDVSCPGTCTKNPEEEKHICEIVDNQHYCEDGEPCDEEEYIKDCLCNPVVTIPSDCNNFDTASTENGYISDIATTGKNCNNSNVVNQIKQCVIDNDDATGESFEATNELSGNPYCKVWCSESYDFELPTAQYSTSGGYFTLSTTITGQRDCYVSSADDPTKPIDEEKFNRDLEEAQKAVMDAWSTYEYWKQAAAISANEEDSSCSGPGDSWECGTEESPETCSCDGCSATGKVVTKHWSYKKYDYSGNYVELSDDYSDGSAASCSTCSCSGSIGHNPDADHRQNRDQAKNALKDAITNLNNVISQYNSCTGAINNNSNTDLSDVKDASSTDSSSWDNDMQFEPTVDFEYNEDYMNQMTGKFKQINDDESSDYMYCSGDTDNQYNCQSGSTSSIVTSPKRVLTCDDDSCSWKNFNVSTANWIRKTKKHEADYIVDDQFSTYTQYGTIKVKWDKCNGNDCLWTNLPEGSLPISLITETGVFPFKFTFGNIGQSNSTTSLGRLIGNDVSVLTAYNNLDKKYQCNGDVSSTTDGGYVCHYINNCPGCDFVCDDDNNCEIEECEDGYCVITCTDENDCHFIYDGANTTYNFRTVSLNNLFPNDRDIGYNWSKTSKAEATLNEISKGLDDSNPESIYETPQYSFTLTPTNLRNIREYNDEAGSFTNSTMPEAVNNVTAATVCEQKTINGKIYPVKCQSTFLDLIETSGNKYATNVVRPDPDDNNSWTLFSDTDYCPNGNCLGDGIGPAWK